MLIHQNKQAPNQADSIERKCLMYIYLSETINFLLLKIWSEIFNLLVGQKHNLVGHLILP